jgi:hypothetical protein
MVVVVVVAVMVDGSGSRGSRAASPAGLSVGVSCRCASHQSMFDGELVWQTSSSSSVVFVAGSRPRVDGSKRLMSLSFLWSGSPIADTDKPSADFSLVAILLYRLYRRGSSA